MTAPRPDAPDASDERGAPHDPVMRDRITALLADAPDGAIVDGTLGAAGHAVAVIAARQERYGHAHLIGIDRDASALALSQARLDLEAPDARVDLVQARFDALPTVLDGLGVTTIAGLLLDLGVSSMHLDQAERGFSYRADGPLDMRMDPSQGLTAADVVNTYTVAELARVLKVYGEERFADRVARAIVAARPFDRTQRLAEVVREAIPAATRRTGGHPATRTFQALRIEVNGELDALAAILPVALDRLAPGGVCAVLSYQSLEDRIVKRAFAAAATGCICPPSMPICGCGQTASVELLTKLERPDAAETSRNRRAEAARFRVVRRLPGTTDLTTAKAR